MAAQNRPEKTMSSRLLTMKFMQRAAASAASPSTSSTPDGTPSKRQKLANSPSTSDLQAVEAAIAAEDAKREAALNRQAAEAGETKWVLSFQDPGAGKASGGLRVRSVGFAGIDAGGRGVDSEEGESEEENEAVRRPMVVGRMSFGNYKSGKETETPKKAYDDGEENDDESAPESGDLDYGDGNSTPRSKNNSASRKKPNAQAKLAAAVAKERRSKDVNLNKISSISSGGGLSSGGNRDANMRCYECGQMGHPKSKCPRLVGTVKKRKNPT